MYNYRVAFLVNDKQLNAWFTSPEKFSNDEETKHRFRERAIMAVQSYLREARSIPSTGMADSLAIWPELLPVNGVLQPLDAFEITE